MAKKPAALPAKKFAEVVDRHNEESAGKTPTRARAALLAQPIEVDGFLVHPASLAIQIILEEINHPILALAAAEDDASAPEIGPRDIMRLLFIFIEPEEAYRVIGYSRENFEAAARDFAFKVPPHVLPDLFLAVQRQMKMSQSTLPPERKSSDPLA